jgi:hypothetical protein
MANLLGQNIGTNYKGILNLDSTINTPLDATLRAVTDGDGNASGLKISTTDSSFSGKLGVGTDAPTATTHIIGVDQLSTSTSLLVQDSIGTNILRVHNQANNSAVVMSTAKIANYEIISGDVLFNTSMRFVPTTGGVAINKDYSSASSNTLVHLKGSGTTSATTSLLVQDSAGTESFKILDNGAAFIRTSLQLGSGVTFSTNTNTLTIGTTLGNVTGNVGTLPVYTFSMISDTSTSNTSNYFSINKTISPSAGSANFRNLIVDYTINASGVQTGTATGIFLNATETNLNGMVHNLMDLQVGGVSKFKVTNTDSSFSGNVGIGTNAPSALLNVQNSINGTLLARFKDNISAATYLDIKTDPTLTDYTALYFGTDRRIMSKQGGSLFLTCSNNVTFVDGLQSKMVITPSEVQIGSISGARLGIKGSGTTSATTSLLVQNSAGTELFKVLDSGESTFTSTYVSGAASNFFNLKFNDGSIALQAQQGSVKNLIIGSTGVAILFANAITGPSTGSGVSIGTATFNFRVQGNGQTNIRDNGLNAFVTASALLELTSTTRGFLPPRMTTTQKNAIATPASGLVVYDTTTNKLACYNGTTWNDLF